MARLECHTSGRTDFGKLMSHNSRVGGPQFHSNEEVEMTVFSCECPIPTMTEFLNLCQEWENLSLFSGCEN
jgi:hypothetical protein